MVASNRQGEFEDTDEKNLKILIVADKREEVEETVESSLLVVVAKVENTRMTAVGTAHKENAAAGETAVNNWAEVLEAKAESKENGVAEAKLENT